MREPSILSPLASSASRQGIVTRLRHGGLELDPKAQVAMVGGRCVELTHYECLVLEHLIRRGGSLVTKGELTSRLYGPQSSPRSNVLEVLVARLRRKLDPNEHLLPIQTLRGRGYRLRG